MKIAIAADHGAFELKTSIIEHLKEKGIEYYDFGCYSKESVDYETHYRSVSADRRHAGLSEIFREVSDYCEIGGTEHLLKDACQSQWKSKPQDLVPEAAFDHRVSVQSLGIHISSIKTKQ